MRINEKKVFIMKKISTLENIKTTFYPEQKLYEELQQFTKTIPPRTISTKNTSKKQQFTKKNTNTTKE